MKLKKPSSFLYRFEAVCLLLLPGRWLIPSALDWINFQYFSFCSNLTVVVPWCFGSPLTKWSWQITCLNGLFRTMPTMVLRPNAGATFFDALSSLDTSNQPFNCIERSEKWIIVALSFHSFHLFLTIHSGAAEHTGCLCAFVTAVTALSLMTFEFQKFDQFFPTCPEKIGHFLFSQNFQFFPRFESLPLLCLWIIHFLRGTFFFIPDHSATLSAFVWEWSVKNLFA